MKIYIDGDNATSFTSGEMFQPPRVVDGGACIDIPVERQAKSKWCWAALAAALHHYYHGKALTQCAIASHALDRNCCDGEAEGCDQKHSLKRILQRAACYSHWSPGKPLFERLVYELNLGKPVCARIEWRTGDAHFVLLRGYNAHHKTLLIEDSLHGPATVPYDDFPHAYRQAGGIWSETYWTAFHTPQLSQHESL